MRAPCRFFGPITRIEADFQGTEPIVHAPTPASFSAIPATTPGNPSRYAPRNICTLRLALRPLQPQSGCAAIVYRRCLVTLIGDCPPYPTTDFTDAHGFSPQGVHPQIAQPGLGLRPRPEPKECRGLPLVRPPLLRVTRTCQACHRHGVCARTGLSTVHEAGLTVAARLSLFLLTLRRRGWHRREPVLVAFPFGPEAGVGQRERLA